MVEDKKQRYLVIDSGTTTTRVRYVEDENVLLSVSRLAGAKDVAIHGDNKVLKVAIKECIEEILHIRGIQIDSIEAILASGMVTSNMGLIDLPHISSPAGIDELSTHLKALNLPEVVNKEITFIPGVKTGFNDKNDLAEKDIIRGEEAEILGYISNVQEVAHGNTIFIHYGSHHKCILMSEGKIIQSYTSLTGELLMTISENTILKNSLLPIDEISIEMDWINKGIDTVKKWGFGRALFSTRVLQVMENRTKNETTNFFIGTLISLDIDILNNLIDPSINSIVLYGKTLFPKIFKDILNEKNQGIKIFIVPEDQSDFLSVYGAIKIYKSFINRR